jgi:hypothetical protein
MPVRNDAEPLDTEAPAEAWPPNWPPPNVERLSLEEQQLESLRRVGLTGQQLKLYRAPHAIGRYGWTVLEQDDDGALYVRIGLEVWKRDPRPGPVVGAEPKFLLLDPEQVPLHLRDPERTEPLPAPAVQLPPQSAPLEERVQARLRAIVAKLKIGPDGAERLSEALALMPRPSGLGLDWWKHCTRCWEPHDSTKRWTGICLACESAAVGVAEHIRKEVWRRTAVKRAEAKAAELAALQEQVRAKLARVEALSEDTE